MWTVAYWKTVGERALATFAAVLVSKLVGGDVLGFDLLAADWGTALSYAGGAGLAVVLLSVGASALPVGGKGNPALARQPEPLPEGQVRLGSGRPPV